MACWRPTRSCAVKSFPLRQSALPRPQARTLTSGRNTTHELGPTAQTGLRYRCGTLPKLRRRLEDHRLDRRSAGNHQDPQPSGPADRAPPRALARRVDLFQTIEKQKTACQPKPMAPLALSSSERRHKALLRTSRRLFRPSRPAQQWVFHQAEKGIDISPGPADMAPVIEKGG